ncbi:MAG: endonuclease/exonuclease/phosphatase family protein [Acidimicrobiales bacterium]
MRNSKVLGAVSWVGAAVVSFVVATVIAGWSPTPLVIAAQGLLPLVVAGGVIVAALSAVRRAWAPTGVALAATGLGAMLVVSATVPADVPTWAASSATAPSFTVFASNLLLSNPDPDRGLEPAVRSDADVIVLSEFVPAFEPALRRSGLLRRYPTVVRAAGGNVLLTKLPATGQGVVRSEGLAMPTASVRVAGRDVFVIGVHTLAPHAKGSLGTWSRNLEGVARAASGHADVIAVGDFNAGPWNGPFRRLLDWGFVDAHRSLGHGLSRTWGPRRAGLHGRVRLLGLDHSLSRGGLAPTSVVDVDVPGSDHRAIGVTYAVR